MRRTIARASKFDAHRQARRGYGPSYVECRRARRSSSRTQRPPALCGMEHAVPRLYHRPDISLPHGMSGGDLRRAAKIIRDLDRRSRRLQPTDRRARDRHAWGTPTRLQGTVNPEGHRARRQDCEARGGWCAARVRPYRRGCCLWDPARKLHVKIEGAEMKRGRCCWRCLSSSVPRTSAGSSRGSTTEPMTTQGATERPSPMSLVQPDL